MLLAACQALTFLCSLPMMCQQWTPSVPSSCSAESFTSSNSPLKGGQGFSRAMQAIFDGFRSGWEVGGVCAVFQWLGQSYWKKELKSGHNRVTFCWACLLPFSSYPPSTKQNSFWLPWRFKWVRVGIQKSKSMRAQSIQIKRGMVTKT